MLLCFGRLSCKKTGGDKSMYLRGMKVDRAIRHASFHSLAFGLMQMASLDHLLNTAETAEARDTEVVAIALARPRSRG